MTLTQFQIAYPYWTVTQLNPSPANRIVDISVVESISIANALRINIRYTNPNVNQSGYIPASAAGFINNYVTFNIGNGSTLLQKTTN
jgi:hypothetical protein